MSTPEFKGQKERVQEAYDRGRRHGFWAGIVACLIGRAVIDIIGALT